jgi:serine/threonine protein kinase/CRP-like cAMP-binding protein
MSSPLPEPEELFGKYELVARIATGGMAEIFRAVSSSIGGFQKVVALKRILPHLSTDAEFVSLFIAEAKLAVALTHSNIVQVLDFGKVEQSHYIAMEFVEGKDLTQILIKQSRARKQVPVEAACYMLAETARALEYAHARKDRDGSPLGIVHRDVSPHNILVSYDGEVKLTDFGIAKAKNHVTLSKPGVILGKFAYMSPEQAHGELIDARTDIYAAGITLYETLTGRRLFYSEDPLQTLAKVRNPKVPLPSRYNNRVTPELDALVMRALAPDPRDRFQTARDLSTALTTYLARTRPDFTDFDIAQFMRDSFGDEVDAAKFSLAPRGSSALVSPATVPLPPAADHRPQASVPDVARAQASDLLRTPAALPQLSEPPPPAAVVGPGSVPIPLEVLKARPAPSASAISLVQRATPLDPRLTPPGGLPTIDPAVLGAVPRGGSHPTEPSVPGVVEGRAETPAMPASVLQRALAEVSAGRVESTQEARIRRAMERLATAPDAEDPLEAETFAPGRLGPAPGSGSGAVPSVGSAGHAPSSGVATSAASLRAPGLPQPDAAATLPIGARTVPSLVPGDSAVEALTARLLVEPNLWILAELGQRLVSVGRAEDGIRALRVAALKFAQNGLLVQALAIYVELLELTQRATQTFREISALGPLAGRPSRAVLELVGPLPTDAHGRLLESLVLGSQPSRVAEMLTAPLFSFLSPDELARFAGLLKLRRVAPATSIVDEGQRGQSLYVIARGRVIIYCQNFQGERVYLSSLSDGDCFGEFSFFTGEPRAATVEAADYVTLFEIAQQDFDRVIDEFPGLTRALLRLYKERVIATLLAKSEVFGVLTPRSRSALLERLEPVKWAHGELIIEEGARDGAFYLVKSGEVEVFTQKNGYVLLSKLKAGDFFGEIAALTGQPRTASVRALCPVEGLRLSAEHLKQLLDDNPDMARVLVRRVKQREAETALRVTAGGVLI